MRLTSSSFSENSKISKNDVLTVIIIRKTDAEQKQTLNNSYY